MLSLAIRGRAEIAFYEIERVVDYRLPLFGLWVSADAAADLAALLDLGSRSTLDAALAAFLLVTSLFLAMLSLLVDMAFEMPASCGGGVNCRGDRSQLCGEVWGRLSPSRLHDLQRRMPVMKPPEVDHFCTRRLARITGFAAVPV